MRAGLLTPLRLNRNHAAIVAALVEARLAGLDLAETPPLELPELAALPLFARKLHKAAMRRRRTDSDSIVVWMLDRREGIAGFNFVALLLLHPAVPDTLTTEQWDAMWEIACALAMALSTRVGPKRLDSSSVERRLNVWEYGAASESDPDCLDDSWIRVLRRRRAEENAARSAFKASLAEPPVLSPRLLSILAPQNYR